MLMVQNVPQQADYRSDIGITYPALDLTKEFQQSERDGWRGSLMFWIPRSQSQLEHHLCTSNRDQSRAVLRHRV